MDWQIHVLRAQLAVLRDAEKTYTTSTIPCAIKQIESRINYIESTNKD